MLSSLHNTAKYLRCVSLKTALQAARERPPWIAPSIKKLESAKRSDGAVNSRVLSFSPRSIGVEIFDSPPLGRTQREPLRYVPLADPRRTVPLEEAGVGAGVGSSELTLPPLARDELQAARLIVIRKKKMKKHQRRKLWKRMRHRWARVRKHRRQVKEKVFQNELLALMKGASEFSAEEFVRDKLQRANHAPPPVTWRHKRLPDFIIRQLRGIDKKVNYKHTDVYKA